MRCYNSFPVASWWPQHWERREAWSPRVKQPFVIQDFPIKLVDTVGAGDAFTAGLVHAYLRGASLPQMAEIGNLCGSYVAGQPGATPPLSAELIERIRALLRG